jgi:DNA-binding MarR family transcriptional regulator
MPTPLAPRPDALPEILDFMRALWALAHGLERASKRMLGDVGVTGPQRLALRMLGLRPGSSAGALAEALHIHPSTLTGVLTRLQTQGLVARVTASDDRRRAILRLTPRGMRVNRRTSGTVEAAVGTALRRVTARDRATTRNILRLLATQLEASATRPSRRG